MKKIILLGAGLLPLASAQEAELRLLNTTDLHGNVASYDYFQDAETERFGLERTASLIAAARAEVDNTLLFDNGDLLQGNPFADYKAKVEPVAPARPTRYWPRSRRSTSTPGRSATTSSTTDSSFWTPPSPGASCRW